MENMDKLEKVQRRATRMMEGLVKYSYKDRLRFLLADLIEVFKILRGFESLDPDKFFQLIGDGARREHSFKLFIVPSCSSLDVGKFKFPNRICEEWNRLGVEL